MVMPLVRAVALTPASSSAYNNLCDEVEAIKTGLYSDFLRTTKPLVQVKRTSAFAVANNTDTIVTWQAIDGTDPDDFWDPGDPTRLTIPVAGWYLAVAQVRWPNTSATGVRNSLMLIHGTSPITNPFANASQPGSTSGAGPTLSYVKPVLCTVGNPLYLNVYQTSGGSMSLQTDYGGTTYALFWMGPA